MRIKGIKLIFKKINMEVKIFEKSITREIKSKN